MGTRFFCLIIVAVSTFQLSEQLENNGVKNYSIAGNPGTNVYLHVNCFNPPQSSDSITTVPNEPKFDQVQIVDGINKTIETMKIKLYEEVNHHLDFLLSEFKLKLYVWGDEFGNSLTQKLLQKSQKAINALDQEANAKRYEFIHNLDSYTSEAIQIYKDVTSNVSVKLTEKLTELNDKIDSIKISNVSTILHHNNSDKVDLLNSKSDGIHSIDFSDSKIDSVKAQLPSQELGSSKTNPLFDFDGSKIDLLEAKIAPREFDSSKSKSSFDFGGANTDPHESQLASHEVASPKTESFGLNVNSLDSKTRRLESSNSKKHSYDFGDPDIYMHGVDSKVHLSDVDDE